jgi:hypothetical protein
LISTINQEVRIFYLSFQGLLIKKEYDEFWRKCFEAHEKDLLTGKSMLNILMCLSNFKFWPKLLFADWLTAMKADIYGNALPVEGRTTESILEYLRNKAKKLNSPLK